MSSVDKIKWAMSLREPQYEALTLYLRREILMRKIYRTQKQLW